jgi:hypothetical protein
MKTRTRIFAMPSPSGTNKEGLFIEQRIRTRDQLGLDTAENLESGTLPSSERGRSAESDPKYELRCAIEKLISDDPGQLPEGLLGKILDLLDAHSPHQSDRMARLVVEPRAKDGIPSARERDVSPLQNEGDESDPRGGEEGGGGTVAGGPWRAGEDDDIPLDFEDFAKDLRRRGLSHDDITKAISLAKDHLRRKRANGRDRFPLRGHNGPIVDRGGQARDGRPDRSDREIAQIHKLMARFEPEAGYSPDRNRFYAEPTERQKADAFRRIPDLARIGSSESGDGTAIRDGTYRSRYEV